MKRFFLFVLLPCIVLGVVYQSGRDAGVRSVVSLPKPEVTSIPEVTKNEVVPALVKKLPNKTVIVPAKNAVEPVKSSPAKTLAVPMEDGSVRTVAVPADSSLAKFVESAVQNPPSKQVSESELRELIAHRTEASVSVQPVPQFVDTDGVVGYKGSPVTNVPYPAPTQSVYDRRLSAVLSKPSELGLMPLVPLAPLPASTYPAVNSAPVVSPVRITSSAECDCGKKH